jgi:hypothetical protein
MSNNGKLYLSSELNNNEYHAEKYHSSSSNLKDLITTKPGRWHKEGELWGIEKFHKEKVLHEKGEPKVSNAFDEGSLAHCLILEPHLLDEEFAVYPGFRKAGKDYLDFKAREVSSQNRTIVSKSQYKKVESWVKGYEKNGTAVDLLKGCEFESSLFCTMDGVKVKVRADAINVEQGYIADVKTTSYDTDVDSFANTVLDFKYQLSGALYCKAFEQYYGKPFDFYFVVLGKKDRSCEVFKLGAKSMGDGLDMVRKALSTYKKCEKSGIWKNNSIAKSSVKCYDDYEIQEV